MAHSRCTGIDCSKKDAKVRIQGQGRRAKSATVTTWGATTSQVSTLREHLVAARVTCVVIESASDYWKPFYLLDEELDMTLVNAAAVRNLPGHKPDVSDAAWLADLGAHGLVEASFVPPPPVRALRDLIRTRTVITRERTREVQRREKLLEDAGIKLSSVASDITGVSGRAMPGASIGGQHDPAAIQPFHAARDRSPMPDNTCHQPVTSGGHLIFARVTIVYRQRRQRQPLWRTIPMARNMRRFLTAVAAGFGLVAALFAGPIVTAQPLGPVAPPLSPNCLPGVHGQIVYCDQDINPDGTWVRCWQPKPEDITIGGATTGDTLPQPTQCRLVRPNELPANSPPFHIGYGGEGRR